MTANSEIMKRGQDPLVLKERAVPAADIFETPEAYVVILDMPGASKESIRVALERNEMTVQSLVPPRHPEGAQVLFSEMRAASYERSFNLGDGINRDTVDATFDQGVLTVKLFKSEEQRRKEIPVH